MLWQSAQLPLSAAGSGMWLFGRSVAPLKLTVLKWQVEHSPAATCALPSALVAGRNKVAGAPSQLWPCSWQLEQAALATALCTMAGGVVPLAFTKLKALKFDALWHNAQSALPTGTWPAGSVTTGGVPTNARPEPWHCAQPSALTAA